MAEKAEIEDKSTYYRPYVVAGKSMFDCLLDMNDWSFKPGIDFRGSVKSFRSRLNKFAKQHSTDAEPLAAKARVEEDGSITAHLFRLTKLEAKLRNRRSYEAQLQAASRSTRRLNKLGIENRDLAWHVGQMEKQSHKE